MSRPRKLNRISSSLGEPDIQDSLRLTAGMQRKKDPEQKREMCDFLQEYRLFGALLTLRIVGCNSTLFTAMIIFQEARNAVELFVGVLLEAVIKATSPAGHFRKVRHDARARKAKNTHNSVYIQPDAHQGDGGRGHRTSLPAELGVV